VAQHDDQARPEARGGELDAADARGRDDVACDADDEQVAQPLIEDDLGGHARESAPQDDRERLPVVRRSWRRTWLVNASGPRTLSVNRMLPS
jgi:hypothetical protein